MTGVPGSDMDSVGTTLPHDRALATDLHVEATQRLMEALVESENRMRRRVELLGDVVLETDADGCIVFLNRAWESVFGLPPRECLGQALMAFFPADAEEDVTGLLRLGPDETGRLVTRITRSAGGEAWVEVSASGISGGGVVGVIRDITREKHYQDELAKLSVVASSTDNLVVITDSAGLIDWVNPAFEARTGYRLDEVRGLKPGSFLQGPDTDPQAVADLGAAFRERRSADVEILNYSRSGEPYWLEVALTPVFGPSGELERYISVQRDVTENHRIDQMKSEFVSTVSHELRTPLTSIIGTLGLIESGVAGAVPERVHGLVGIAHRNSQRLRRLIDDLLDMEKLVEGKVRLDMTVTELMPIVDRAVLENQAFATEYGVHLAVVQRCDGAVVDVDPLRMHQVLSNLLSNAAKFSHAGGRVDVRVSVDGSSLMIDVEDFGHGIPEEFRDRIFEKFSQADASSTRQQGGTGLGLAITRELVQRMGGSIGFESRVGEGTCFRVRLPRVESEESSSPEAAWDARAR
jgi:PAS domain S-box-containing protein